MEVGEDVGEEKGEGGEEGEAQEKGEGGGGGEAEVEGAETEIPNEPEEKPAEETAEGEKGKKLFCQVV